MRITRFLTTSFAAVAMLVGGTASSRADLLFTTSTATPQPAMAASADFNLSGTTLTVTLTNTGTTAITDSSQVLTDLFFNVTSGTLTPVAPGGATLGSGSTLLQGSLPSGNTLGDFFGFTTTGVSSHYSGMNTGLGAAGLNIGTLGQGAFGSNPAMVDGVDYGILTSNSDGSGSGLGTTHGPLVGSTNEGTSSAVPPSVTLKFTVNSGFTLADIGTSVIFQYGTSTGDSTLTGTPSTINTAAVPEPSTMILVGLGALGFLGYGLRRRFKK